ncbi:hypothetical protein KIN20_028943 [Parelaphostrongylus tenuis]|uniref:Uncharacterized protein n=1 Tax=Parelaphostrongylus tenuis TaxID=148309 RepID=A0AAD5R1I8_PARTN|nr:hypothetical protein KIN20_028943 [Parelaphostrongylus tenuis]
MIRVGNKVDGSISRSWLTQPSISPGSMNLDRTILLPEIPLICMAVNDLNQCWNEPQVLHNLTIYSVFEHRKLASLRAHESLKFSYTFQELIESRTNRNVMKKERIDGYRKHEIHPTLSKSGEALIVMPLLLIIFALFCIVGFSNVCRDDLMDELHSNGLNVIRSEEGTIVARPCDYAN